MKRAKAIRTKSDVNAFVDAPKIELVTSGTIPSATAYTTSVSKNKDATNLIPETSKVRSASRPTALQRW